MESIKIQLREDIKMIKDDWGYMDQNLSKDEFAFNYWVLSRLYTIDEQIIPSLVTDYNDKNIDCFVHYEDTKELFIIQNKYYSDTTPLSRNEASDFLTTPISVLKNNAYTRSKDLQKAFNQAKKDPDYKIWLHFYISNEKTKDNDDVMRLFNQFNYQDDQIDAFIGAEIFTLSDIRDKYYGKRYRENKKFTYVLDTTNKATALNILPEEFKLPNMLKTHYIMTSVYQLYDMYLAADKCEYPLFEENIREFLGTKGINNGIIKTLKNPNERHKFFYYNNGITIICDDSGKKHKTKKYALELINPQIVNGCQTINSIYEVLSSYGSNEEIRKEFENTYVITKVLVFGEKTHEDKRFYSDIVKYTNTQNSINEKAFASNTNYFDNMQREFRKRGLLLAVKPSDVNKFTLEYKDKYKFAELKKQSYDLFAYFDIDNGKVKDYIIPLEKLLQVLLAFIENGYFAFTKKNYVLKRSSKIYEEYSLKFHEYLSFDEMIKVYFLYKKAEFDKKASTDKKTPIPYYVVNFISYKVDKSNREEIGNFCRTVFDDKEYFNSIYNLIKKVTTQYRSEYCNKNNLEYNEMIKNKIDLEILEKSINNALMYSDFDDKAVFK